MKVLATATEAFGYLNDDGVYIDNVRPYVTEMTAFVEIRVAQKLISLGANLIDEANDEDLAGFIAEAKDIELGVAAFLSAFAVKEPDGSAPTTVTKKKK